MVSCSRRSGAGRSAGQRSTGSYEEGDPASGLEGFQFRDLRHTGATLALQEGVSPVLVAFRLGHTTTRMIETIYGSVTPL
jgi:integrase